ncbi:MAG: DUF2339 domain-containing protein [Spirochaetes bacterium]|nr:DUF2339 domain-containing protein [Spirochaetota bacterium]
MPEIDYRVQCPSCGETLAGPSPLCPACGYRFDEELQRQISLLFFYLKERESLGRMRDEAEERLRDLSPRIEAHRSALGESLETRSAEAAARREEARKDRAAAETPQPQPAVPERPGKSRSELELRMGQRWLLIAGIVTTVFGVGYFLKYSFERGWIGPAGRVAAAYLFGLAFLAAGDRFRKRDLRLFGLSLIGGGIAVLYFATFAAFQIYDLFGAAASFGLMVLITALACALAIVYDTKWLAVLGLIGGFLTPVLLSTGVDNQPVLMGYMALLNAGILAVAFRREWPLLTVLGFIATFSLYSGWYAKFYAAEKFWLSILSLTLFYLIYAVAPLAYHVFRKSEEKIRGLIILVPDSFIAFGFSFCMIRDRYSVEWVGAATIFYAAVFFVLALALYRTGRAHLRAFVLLIAKSALFLIITVPVILSGHWITVFWAAQAVTLLWAGLRLENRPLEWGAHLLAGMALCKFLFYDYPFVFGLSFQSLLFKISYDYTMAERYATTLLLLSVLCGYFLLLRRRAARIGNPAFRTVARTSLVALAATLFVSLNIETAALFGYCAPGARFAAITVLWTLYSAGVMIAGFRWNSAAARTSAIVLFGITLLKVFFLDISNFSTPFRILSFIVLGMVLVAASFLYYRFKDRIIEALAEKKEASE